MGDGKTNQFGDAPDYIVESAITDEHDVTKMTLLVKRPYPVDFSLFSLRKGPQIGIPIKGMNHAAKPGWQEFRYNYEGAFDPDYAESQVQFELDFALEVVGLDAFPLFSQLEKKYGVTLNKETGLITCQRTMKGDPNTPNPLFGTDSFQIVGLIWRKKTVSKVLNPSFYRNIGHIDTPEGGDGQSPPQLTNGGNWKLDECGASWAGNLWRLTKGWRASGLNGPWLRDIYGSTALSPIG